jgi:hypothetical protein
MASIVVAGDTSGTVTLTAPATAGTTTLTLPTTSGTVLTSASTLSGAQGASMVLIGSVIASNSATVDFTSISNSTYSAYKIFADNIVCQTNGTTLQMRVSVGGSFQSGSVYGHRQWRWVTGGSAASGSNGDTQINISSGGDTMSNNSSYGNSFELTAYNQAQTTTYKRYTWTFTGLCSDQITLSGGAYYLSTSNAVDGFRFLMSSGNIVSGTFSLYGIRNS